MESLIISQRKTMEMKIINASEFKHDEYFMSQSYENEHQSIASYLSS